MDIIIVIYNPPPSNPKTCTGYTFDEDTHPGGKFHDSGTVLVLQVTNAGVRRPGYEAMLVLCTRTFKDSGKCIIHQIQVVVLAMRLYQPGNQAPSALE